MTRFLIPLLFLCNLTNAVASELTVFVSVWPQRFFVEQIGGPAVSVRAMVREGFNPATYEPTPRQIAALGQADIYVRSGVPFEDSWMQRISSVNPGLLLLDMREGVELIKLDDSHHGLVMDPHIWTDPLLVKHHVALLRDRLMERLPGHAHAINANYAAFVSQLEALDEEIRQSLAHLEGKRFLVFHPAWGYFARRYGLEQIAVEHEGKEPTAAQLARLITLARNAGTRFILVQPQQNARIAQTLADAIGARVVTVDPLSEDYFASLRDMVRVLGDTGQ